MVIWRDFLLPQGNICVVFDDLVSVSKLCLEQNGHSSNKILQKVELVHVEGIFCALFPTAEEARTWPYILDSICVKEEFAVNGLPLFGP